VHSTVVVAYKQESITCYRAASSRNTTSI